MRTIYTLRGFIKTPINNKSLINLIGATSSGKYDGTAMNKIYNISIQKSKIFQRSLQKSMIPKPIILRTFSMI